MGHGAPRELGGDLGPRKLLEPDDSQALEQALKKYEAGDPAFATSREDERLQQMSKLWVNRCNEIVEDLRSIGKAIVEQHQVLLDTSQDGAGLGATPWIEEAGFKFERLHFRLRNGPVIAETGMTKIAEVAHMKDATYEWLEKAVVKWLIHEAAK
ncbi:MAG: hypothetical protein H6737_28170 [Alphaproteobacteria bacterium]|nr:hypothetical protein [Alphaproteobacteria bacterium]